jgi:hypothetical protein
VQFNSMKIRHKNIASLNHPRPAPRCSAACCRRDAAPDLSAVCAFRRLPSAILRPSILISSMVAALAVMSLTPIQASAETINRLLAAVNGKVITAGDVGLSHSLNEILMPGNATAKMSDEDEIQRLIDLEILRQEMENFPDVTGVEEQVESRMEALRKSYDEDGGLAAVQQKLGLQESELRSYLRLQVSALRLIDLRFRPFVSVTEDEIEEYYRTKLLPQTRASGADEPALEAVSSKIRTILTEEKVNSSLNQWLQDTRRHSKIEYFGRDELKPGGAEQ